MSDALFTSAQLAEFRDLLSRRKQRLVALLQSQRVVDARMIYLVGCTSERNMDRRAVESERKQLAEINSALQRLETGAFGLCARCGHAIHISRLHPSPTTRLCRRCVGDALAQRTGDSAMKRQGCGGAV